MAFYEVYSHPALIRYRSSVCTKATLFAVVALCLTYIPPLLVAYRSQGFWLKTKTYEEQPVVRFQYQTILMASTSAQGDYVAWSTFPHFNHLVGARLRIPSLSVREEDDNQDGKLDRLLLDMQLPLRAEEQLYSLQLLLTFNYQLFRMSTVVMQSLACVHYSSAVPGARLFISGDLRLQQRAPLPHRGLYNVYNVSVIDSSSPFASAYEFDDIIRKYQQRNLTTFLSTAMPVWTPGRAPTAPFVLSAEIHYSTETITYYPGFWETIKFAWIQYVSVLLVFLWVLQRIQTFVFEKQLLTTVPGEPAHHHKLH
ncbi:transmembrane protein 231 isoform X2 [Boleophthalmus pectinirostris]|uniref:transmembrane protein 231 isoform X2 n=1 Tax=Boleophthalmus pectinirostris TaxID=150288 RepID=UPI000A1C250C|nr:transmembrane protein 231 isoform X2 [Boleophthalmus pectinirostris]